MSNISSTNPTYLSALRGDTVGSVQSLLAQIRGLMGEVDQQVNGLQAELQGTMEATVRERHRLDFMRELNTHMPASGPLSSLNREGIAAMMTRHGINPGANAGDQAMCVQLGLYVNSYVGGGTQGAIGTLTWATEGTATPANRLDKTSISSFISTHQSTLETLTNSMSQDSTRLQALMNRRGEFMSTISQCINSDHTTSNSIIQNIR